MDDPFAQGHVSKRAADDKKATEELQIQKDAENYAKRTKTILSQPTIKPRGLGSY
jgi:hypothetical protein